MYRYFLCSLATSLLFAVNLAAAVITVTTTDNANPGTGKSLLQALGEAQVGDTIAFNIPGDGPHYIATPTDGYPLIHQNNLTIDGYTQSGATPNTNPLRAANNAKLKIVLDSRDGGRTKMNYQTGRPGYDDSENAILGIFNAANVTIRGLCFLGKHTANSSDDPAIYCLALARDYTGDPTFDDNAHVSGCWFGVEPDGVSVTGGSRTGIAFFRHRDVSGGTLPELPNRSCTIGVKNGSANPRAEFNVMADMEYYLAAEAIGTRVSGNFMGVLPDGRTHWSMIDRPFAGATLEIGRYDNSTILIGTDGDGLNDSEEGNIFGPPPDTKPVLSFYGTGNKSYIIAGNNFGLAVDGVTRFPGTYLILDEAGSAASTRIGSDLDGVSDECEANRIANNTPFDPAAAPYNPIVAIAGAHLSVRGNVLINNYPIPVNIAGGRDPDPQTFYTPHLVPDSSTIQPVISLANNQRLEGTTPVANTNFAATLIDLYLSDPEGITNGMSAGIDLLPNGFVQGIKYIASFVDNSTEDSDKTAGSFSFDVSGLHLGGGNFTITANYVEPAPRPHNAPTVTSPFSEPVQATFLPEGIASASLQRIVPDTILFERPDTGNLDNWEPYVSVLGTNVFLIEANGFAVTGPEDATPRQRYRLAFQRTTGGSVVESDGFFGDDGQPFTNRINLSRDNGNPGRVAGDVRPGAVNYLVGGEASPHAIDAFRSDNRWDLGSNRAADARYAVVQPFSLNLTTLLQTPLSKVLDAVNGRLDATAPVPPSNQISRFGGDVVFLDNGNFLVVVDDRSGVLGPAGGSTTAVILSPTGQIVKDTFLVEPRDIWSNVCAVKGGFAIRSHERLFFYQNNGELKTTGSTRDAGLGINEGDRGDGVRIGSHINGHHVFLAGVAAGKSVLAAWDARDGNYLGYTTFSEDGMTPVFDRVNLAVDALDRVAVAYEAKPSADYTQFQTLVRIFQFEEDCNAFTALTPSFFAFTNNATTAIRTIRPSIAMTTRAILVAAKGEINRENNPAADPNTPSQTTIYTVFSHPVPADDPTTPVGGGGEQVTLSISKNGATVVLSWPTTATGFILEATDSLITPNWSAVGSENPTTQPTSGAARYFRLRK